MLKKRNPSHCPSHQAAQLLGRLGFAALMNFELPIPKSWNPNHFTKKCQKIHWKLSPIFKKTIPHKITRLYRLCLWEAVDEVAGVSALP
jgi:hypothetical protein